MFELQLHRSTFVKLHPPKVHTLRFLSLSKCPLCLHTQACASKCLICFTYLMGGVSRDEMKLSVVLRQRNNRMQDVCVCGGGIYQNLDIKNWSQTNTCSRQIQGMLSRMDEWEDWVTAWITYMHGLTYSCCYRWYNIHCSLKSTSLNMKRWITFLMHDED